jgi:predicted DCC family thiol-disulfide oxidoreductase YuxK
MGRVASGTGTKHLTDHPLVLFDGVCHLCNGSVKFLIKRDTRAILHYAALQSEYARERIRQAGIPEPIPDGVILLEKEKYYLESDAMLRCFFHLGPFWKVVSFLSIIPRRFRQFFYKRIARNRYQWFGQYETCVLPEPGWKDRFEDQTML